ncbi:MAG: hypothetical protein M3076_19960 [Actinomycetota bacterium]|nr:hypothetical protein [Actinomycetota bacterium]
MTDEIMIAARFNGPPTSGNGGYACGLVSAAIGPSALVRLSLPPPLDVQLTRHRDADGSVRLMQGDATVAAGRPASPAVDIPATPTLAVATRCSELRWSTPGAPCLSDMLCLRSEATR